MVSGDKVSEIKHYIKVPETFSRRFEEMRSANNTLASSASMSKEKKLIILISTKTN